MEKSLRRKIILIVIIYFFLRINAIITTSTCFIRGIFGIPCPACGMTRAYYSLFKGDFIKAMYFNPLFLAPVVLMNIYIFKKNKFNIAIKIVVILSIMVYVIRMYYMFPNKSPMLFNNNAIVPKILRIIKSVIFLY